LSACVEHSLKNILLDEEQFRELANQCIESIFLQSTDPQGTSISNKAIVSNLVNRNIDNVARFCESPIEIIFLHALILGFIRSDPMGLVSQPIFGDIEAGLKAFIKRLQDFKRFTAWYDRHFCHDGSIIRYLDLMYESGSISKGERTHMVSMVYRYYMPALENSFHLTLQPRFQAVRVEGKTIRCDMLFWIPANPEIRIIVECDGYGYHSSKVAFITDRKRDRASLAKGYQTMRFSGTEICKDPACASQELAQYLHGVL